MSKATRRYTPEKLTRSDLAELVDKLKQKNSTYIFKKLGVRRYIRHGSTFCVPGIAAIQGLPKNAPVRLLNDNHYYRAEELLDIWQRWATNSELERIIR